MGVKLTYGPDPSGARLLGIEGGLAEKHIRLRRDEAITRADVRLGGASGWVRGLWVGWGLGGMWRL
jgi:hypothetical protein